MNIKRATKYAWPWLSAVLCVRYLCWTLEAYRVHCDAGSFPMILSFLAFAAITVFTICQWRKDRAAALSAVIKELDNRSHHERKL